MCSRRFTPTLRQAATAVQDADQVDERVLAARQALEHPARVDVRFDDVDRGKEDQVLGALAAPRRHRDPQAAPRELGDQVPPNEAGSAKNEDPVEPHCSSSSTGSGPLRGAMVPSRAFSGETCFWMSAA
jgi:hypothetical protein